MYKHFKRAPEARNAALGRGEAKLLSGTFSRREKWSKELHCDEGL